MLEVFALGLAAVLPMRIYQVIYLIEPETGFFSNSSMTIPLLYGITGVLCLFFIAGSFVSKKAALISFPTKKDVPLGICGFITAVSLVVDAVLQGWNFYEIASEYSAYSVEITMMSYLTKNGATPLIFGAVFGAVAALYFWLVACSFFDGKTRVSSFKVIAVAPLAWAICRIIHRFVRKISFVNVSDLLLELFMLVFMMLFFLAFAQLASNVDPAQVKWRVFGFGLPAAITAVVCNIPRLLMLVTGRSDMLSDMHPFQACDLALALFIFVLLFRMAGGSLKKSKAEATE